MIDRLMMGLAISNSMITPPPLLVLLLLLFAPLLPVSVSVSASAINRPEVITSTHGAVAADDARCSAAGRDALRDGGSAVDAAVTVALCLGVVSPASSGLGGGAFMLVRLSSGDAWAFDMRETAPLSSSQDMYANNNSESKSSGPLSIAVPGELAGLYKAWKRYGKLPWPKLVAPAINLAQNGFQVSRYLRVQMESAINGVLSDEGLRQVFTINGTDLLKVGDICYNKRLAKTLQKIAKQGASAFYNGSVGAGLVADVKKRGGILSMEDLRRYKVKVTRPLSADAMGLKFLGMPPPSAGGAGLILVLNILSQYGNGNGIPAAAVAGPLGVHRLIESLKHFFAIRPNLGDPDFIDDSKVLSDMLSPTFAAKLKNTILDNTTFGPAYYGDKWNIINEHGTSHICVVDSERNAVSMTSTINYYFGSQILSLNTGIVLNNEMDDFSVPSSNTNFTSVPPPAPNNFISPSKRPMSSMTPTIVLKDGELKAVVGASGGVMIPAATIQVVFNHFALQLDPFSSVFAPRVYHKLIPNVVQYENWTTVSGDHIELPASTREELQQRGHVLQGLTSGGAISQFIVHNFGELTAVSDPRKGGLPAGF
ncbi:Gamma-glutamyltranspeptidase [Rhynchospora pubera]|uniref:Glutathione hydrolase n=1 Tax=Rhynchospora pubera TaxID=906938 RepID=A0AAV8FQZ1_9POAL|nr:Gamma-glutamyltranspeptidase [Rhynchospora pubera]